MGIREKLLDFKRRLSDRKMYSVTLVVIAAVTGWGIYQYRQVMDLRQELENQYNRAFFDMNGYVNNIESLLMKSMLTPTSESTGRILQEAWRQSNLAQENLGQLPVTQPALANTSKFLTQVGDFAYALNTQEMGGTALKDDQYKTLESLHGYAVTLRDSLYDLQGQITEGRLKWKELADKGTQMFDKTSKEMSDNQVENVDKTFKDSPKLIYDGPFSDHLVTLEPRGVAGEQLDIEAAKQKVIEFFGKDRVKEVLENGRNDTGPINTYSFKVNFNEGKDGVNTIIDVTQKGGHPYFMLNDREVPGESLNIDQAKEAGRAFLEARGYTGMVDTYYLREDNTAVVNYAYKQDDVVVYPDLIKVKVALDNGEVVGLEANGYLYSHVEREIPEQKITEEEARRVVGDKMEVLSVGKALIPTEFKTEIFTYEFKGKFKDQDFLMYVNADTGKIEDVLIIIDTPNGILTM